MRIRIGSSTKKYRHDETIIIENCVFEDGKLTTGGIRVVPRRPSDAEVIIHGCVVRGEVQIGRSKFRADFNTGLLVAAMIISTAALCAATWF